MWFAHPLRVPVPAVTAQGAALFRIMLVVCAAALVVIPLRLSRGQGRPREIRKEGLGSTGLWILCGLIVMALLTRATRLGESLWYDEISTWGSFGVYGTGPIMGNLFEQSNHIAHTLLSAWSVDGLDAVLGFELALRLPALLFSLAAVPATFGMTRWVLSRPWALVAAALMAVMPVAVLEGVEARGYSMMICMAALAHWTFLANLEDERPWRWCLYAGLCALGAWAQLVTVFVPVGHAAWLAWCGLRHGRTGLMVRGGLALLLAAIVTVTLYAPAIPDLLEQRRMYTAARGDEPEVFGAEGRHALLQLGGSWYAWAAWPGLVIATVGLIRALRDDRLRAATAITLLGLPLFVLTVLVAGSWLYARFMLFALPGAVLLTAIGFRTLWNWKPSAAAAAAAIVLAAGIGDLAVRPAKQPLRDAADYVLERAAGEDVVVVGLAHQVMNPYLLPEVTPHYSLRHGINLAATLEETDARWVILYYPNHVAPDTYALLIQRGFAPVKRLRGWVDWDNGDVLVFQR